MKALEAIKTGFAKTFRYSGRASRSEFWWFFLLAIVGFTLAVLLDKAIFGQGEIGRVQIDGTNRFGISGRGPLSAVAFLVVFFPCLAASVRRLHDRGRAGWWIGVPFLLFFTTLAYGWAMRHFGTVDGDGAIHLSGGVAAPALIMMFGGFGILIWNLVSLIRGSQSGPNRYGPNPFEVTP